MPRTRDKLGLFERRNAQKQRDRERLARDIAAGRVDPDKTRADNAFIKNPEHARIIRDGDLSRWCDND